MRDNPSTRSTLRGSRRFAPRNAVTVAIHERDAPFAYGIVTNISPSGACVVTATPLPTGTQVFLRVSFYRQTEMFETPARVVWSRDDTRTSTEEGASQGFLFHGVQFAGTPTKQRSRLLHLLDTSEFQLVYTPATHDFDSFVSEISEDLNRLGSKFGQKTGSD